MESISKESIEYSQMELLPTEILQKILSYLPVHDRVRVERVCKRWKNVSTEEVWKDVRVLSIATKLNNDYVYYHPFNDLNESSKFNTMENNKLYIDLDELSVIQSLVSKAGRHVKEFIFDSDYRNGEPALSIIATHCHNIQSIQLHRVDNSNIEMLPRLLEINKRLHSIACCHIINFIEILPLRDWKSLYIGGLSNIGREQLRGIQKEQWEEKVVALIKNSPSLEEFYVYDWTPKILTAISKCKQLKSLVFPIQDERARNYLMMNISLLNRLTCLKVECREDEDNLIINLLCHCMNLEGLGLYSSTCAIPNVVQEAVLTLPKLESLEIDSPYLTDKILNRLLKFKHLGLKNCFDSITENGIFEMITNSKCLEKLEVLNINVGTDLFKRLIQSTRESHKIWRIRVDLGIYKKALEICGGSRIYIIQELDDSVRNIANWIRYDW